MNNTLVLTDDELAVVQTSLQLTIMSVEKYKQANGDESVDFETRNTLKVATELHRRFNQEYF